MRVKISDDFDLMKIVDSGQCFRPKKIENGSVRFISGKNFVYIKRIDEDIFDVNCTPEEWNGFWKNYFDLETNYSEIRRKIYDFAAGRKCGNFLKEVTDCGAGIRILKQEPFEMLLSFIISQRKSIPSIRSSVEKISNFFGREVETPYEKIRLFPAPEDFSAGCANLEKCGLAYRQNYLEDAIKRVLSCELDLEKISNLPDDELLTELQKIKGVGMKVANCVALFAYHRVDCAPVDVWIKRAIDEDFDGENIFEKFGKYAGILQQYVFFGKRTLAGK